VIVYAIIILIGKGKMVGVGLAVDVVYAVAVAIAKAIVTPIVVGIDKADSCGGRCGLLGCGRVV
jgi:low affinity Fe/Cu permease